MEQLISQTSAPVEGGSVVFIENYKKEEKFCIEKWLEQKAREEYGEEDVETCMTNHYLRLLLKYDGLSGKEQESMFGYTEKVMAEHRGRRINKRNIFTELLCLGNYETWEMIEEYTDRLLSGAGIGKADVHTGQSVTRSTVGMEGGAF